MRRQKEAEISLKTDRGLAIKPRAYYAAKHWWQRLRIARNRRRIPAYGWTGVRLLGYHRVSDDDDELAVSPARFRAQMEALADADVTVVGLEQAGELLNNGADGRYVCVTFDDGYRDNLEQAVPILERLQMPAQIYLATAVIDGGARFGWYREQPPLLTWDEVRDLARTELFSFGAQSRTHPVLTHLTDDQAWEEIFGAKRDLEEQLKESVTAFCYPGGLFTDREQEYVRRAGFTAGITCEPGVNTKQQPRETLLRTMIDRRDSIGDFHAKIAGLYDETSALRVWVRGRRIRG